MRDLIASLLTAPLENLGFDCEEIAVTPAGRCRRSFTFSLRNVR